MMSGYLALPTLAITCPREILLEVTPLPSGQIGPGQVNCLVRRIGSMMTTSVTRGASFSGA
jgi:hypothetical protein